ncbi:MAG: PIN domain-containing protein [Zoogloea sp.]|jgi:predicted nucleic acid-binding protein|uniref:PIN domain-containing protein n=1 Tax=Dokdonella sp. TaxID=2291710 RepID=UPI001B534965|nr:PIN domain-containing protein [Dokdonella sp.]MBL0284840.1 PIN domain-containing protein [Zoogloea sp.]MBP7393549.1 PIN domain-containing protein [Zoogloea sp.]
MSAPYFLDTNILIYATSLATDHATKRPAARNWVARTDWGLSTQVLMEFYANARQARHGLLPTAPQTFVERIAASRPVQAVDRELVLAALSLRNRYNLSHWDAAILCAAARLGAHTVISEDLSHGQRYDGITVLNPFLG